MVSPGYHGPQIGACNLINRVSFAEELSDDVLPSTGDAAVGSCTDFVLLSSDAVTCGFGRQRGANERKSRRLRAFEELGLCNFDSGDDVVAGQCSGSDRHGVSLSFDQVSFESGLKRCANERKSKRLQVIEELSTCKFDGADEAIVDKTFEVLQYGANKQETERRVIDESSPSQFDSGDDAFLGQSSGGNGVSVSLPLDPVISDFGSHRGANKQKSKRKRVFNELVVHSVNSGENIVSGQFAGFNTDFVSLPSNSVSCGTHLQYGGKKQKSRRKRVNDELFISNLDSVDDIIADVPCGSYRDLDPISLPPVLVQSKRKRKSKRERAIEELAAPELGYVALNGETSSVVKTSGSKRKGGVESGSKGAKKNVDDIIVDEPCGSSGDLDPVSLPRVSAQSNITRQNGSRKRKSKRERAIEELASPKLGYVALNGESSGVVKTSGRKRKGGVEPGSKGAKKKKSAAKTKAKCLYLGPPRARIDQLLPIDRLHLSEPSFCCKCGAKKFTYESENFCCGNGEIVLAVNEFPAELIYLFTAENYLGKHFRKYARMYNNLFAYSSIGGHLDAETVKGIYVFKLHGQIYHFVPELLPGEGQPKYLQLYFYDGQYEAINRKEYYPEVDKEVIEILMRVTSLNPYARFFRSLQELHVTDTTRIVLNQNPVLDQRLFNAPATDEVAVIWPDNLSSSECTGPHILIHGKTGEAHRVYHYFGCYDPLQYPLLFPYGESGWCQGMKKVVDGRSNKSTDLPDPINSCAVHTVDDFIHEETMRATKHKTRADKFISAREYYAYKLQIRSGNMLLATGRCLQQFFVDMYVKMENTRLDYLRNNQDTIRADLYQGILDSYQNGETSGNKIGHRVILPPSFLGGPRDLKRRYLNAMALVQRYGKPDLFVTMTCNVNWPEIKAELSKTETAQDRPDVVARIFRAKLLALKKQIKKEHVFGEVAAMVYVVEFQKRGLPHAHFLIILKADCKIRGPADYDAFVCAEIPSANKVLLRKSVLAHMMHGPCGHLNPACPCMRKVKDKASCKSGYPKNYNTETTCTEEGYPLYRRRCTGELVKIRGKMLDNRWVVPYNPYLLVLFDCHINVEICSTIKAVKYLYKYVYKGHDRVSYNISSDKIEVIDEIEQYQSGRWVSPCEAAWRLFSFDLFEIYPPVLPLPVHLPNSQTIQIRSYEHLRNVVKDPKRSKTALTEFFAFNAANTRRVKYLYGEFTEHYRWDAPKKCWVKRKNNVISIGRPAFVLPAEGERFFLRLLLLNVRGPTSFEDIRTINGYLCSTFQEAALKLGLLEDDDAAGKCLAEAVEVQLPSALRRLFAIVLVFCQASDPKALWEKYYDMLSEDFKYNDPDDEVKVKELTVSSFEQYLEAMGKSLKTYGLDHLHSAVGHDFRITRDISDALNEVIPIEFINATSLLNIKQKEAFDCIMEHVISKKGGAFFIDGPGGTGKTFLYNILYAEIRRLDKIVLPTATSGIAALNMPGGRTAHSRFKIPINHERGLACDVPKQSSLAYLIKEAALIIWDEASMANKSNVASLDLLLQDICDNKLLFGGKLVVFGGDFRQVLPVVPLKTQRQAVEASIVSSYLWPKLIKFRLTENQRAHEDANFCDFLLALGNGTLQHQESEFVQVPEKMLVHLSTDQNATSELLAITFPEIKSGSVDSHIFMDRAILSPLNIDVDMINADIISCFPGEPVVYKSFDIMLNDTSNIYPTEFINKLCPGGMSPHELVLKIGCPVVLIRNLLPSAGLCNGTRMICTGFSRNVIQCVISVGQYKRRQVLLPRINLRPSNDERYPFQFERKQFPLKLSFAMTVNKSQGQTLNRVTVYLPRSCFSHGQLYVALSRARKATNVTILSSVLTSDVEPHGVKNVVSFSVLELAGIRQRI